MDYQKFENGFRKLIAWQEAHQLTLEIYKISMKFADTEKFGITSQLRRAASSIGAQIAEGSRMRTMPHRRLYYERSYASAAEVDNFLELAHDLAYITSEQYRKLLSKVNRISYLLRKLIESCNRRMARPPTLPTVPTLPSPHFTLASHNHAPTAAH